MKLTFEHGLVPCGELRSTPCGAWPIVLCSKIDRVHANRTEPNKPNRNRTELAEPAQTAEPAEPVEPSNLEPAEPVEPSARTPAPAPALVHGVLVKRCTVRLSKFARCACLELHGALV